MIQLKFILIFSLLFFSFCKYTKFIEYTLLEKPIKLRDEFQFRKLERSLTGNIYDLRYDCNQAVRSEFSKEIKFIDDETIQETTYSSSSFLDKDGVTIYADNIDTKYGNYFFLNKQIYSRFTEESLSFTHNLDLKSNHTVTKTKLKEPFEKILHSVNCTKEDKNFIGIFDSDWGFYILNQ